MATIMYEQKLTESKIPYNVAEFVSAAGKYVLTYGLVLIFAWIGFLKFQSYEADAIMPLISHSPFMSWMIDAFGTYGTARAIGAIEIVIAVLIAQRPTAPKLCLVGALMAAGTFVTTLSFLATTPEMAIAAANEPFPLLSMVGQFLIKDVVLLGAALFVAGDAWLAVLTNTQKAKHQLANPCASSELP